MDIISKFISKEEKGFLFIKSKSNNSIAVQNENYRIYKFGDVSVICSMENEYGQKILVNETEDYLFIFDGKYYDYNNLCEDDFLIKFPDDLITGAENTLHILDAEYVCILFMKKSGDVIVCRGKLGYESIFYGRIGDDLLIFNRFHHLMNYKGLKLSKVGVSLQLMHNFISPPYTFFENIYSLPAGFYSKINLENDFYGIDKSHRRYWKLKYDFKSKSGNDIFEIFRNEYLKSIKKRLNDNINPLLYSGGLDSSTVLFGLKQLVKPELIEPYFFYFSEYDAQYMFEGPVNRLMKELNLKLNTLEIKFTEDDLFGFVSDTMRYTQSTYSSTHAWVKVAQMIKEKYGFGKSVFLGESADGLFGINRTDEGADLFIRDFNTHFNRNKTLLNLNFGDNSFERLPSSIGSLLFLSMSPSLLLPRGLGKVSEMLCGIFSSRTNFKDVSLGLYFGWDGYPVVKRKSMYSDYFSPDLNETILQFFEKEYVDSAMDFYEDGGIGCVTKSIIYRLEGEGIDMKMKMLPKFYGIRPEFPIFDGKFMEIAYKIPNKYYNYTKSQRPKYPLRVLGKNLGIPQYILDIKKVTGSVNSLSPDETLYRSKFGTELKKLISKRRLLDCLDSGNFNKELIESIYTDFINKDKNFQEPNRMRIFFALEKLIEDYL